MLFSNWFYRKSEKMYGMSEVRTVVSGEGDKSVKLGEAEMCASLIRMRFKIFDV